MKIIKFSSDKKLGNFVKELKLYCCTKKVASERIGKSVLLFLISNQIWFRQKNYIRAESKFFY